jgi:hypothetical protein
MINKIKNVLLLLGVFWMVVNMIQIHSLRYENQLLKKANQNWSDFSEFQDSNRVAVTSNLVHQIQSLERKQQLTNR